MRLECVECRRAIGDVVVSRVSKCVSARPLCSRCKGVTERSVAFLPEPLFNQSPTQVSSLRRRAESGLSVFDRWRQNHKSPAMPCPIEPSLERSFRGHKDVITSVAFNPNMKQLITGGLDSCVMVWNFKLQLRAFRFVGHKDAVLDVACAPSGTLIASASKDRTIRLWLPTVKGESTVVKAHTAAVRSVAFSNDGQSLLSASDDKTIKIWSLPGQRFQCSLSGHSNWVRAANFSPDGRLIVSCGDDKTVKLWDARQKTCLHTFYDHSALVHACAVNPDGTCVASASQDCTVKLWDLRKCHADADRAHHHSPFLHHTSSSAHTVPVPVLVRFPLVQAPSG